MLTARDTLEDKLKRFALGANDYLVKPFALKEVETRVAQGAHFLSHNLWSALVCWLVIRALCLAIMGTPKDTQPVAAATCTG